MLGRAVVGADGRARGALPCAKVSGPAGSIPNPTGTIGGLRRCSTAPFADQAMRLTDATARLSRSEGNTRRRATTTRARRALVRRTCACHDRRDIWADTSRHSHWRCVWTSRRRCGSVWAPKDRGHPATAHGYGAVREPEDIVSAVAWLVSDGARYVTGVTLPVDAGFTVR